MNIIKISVFSFFLLVLAACGGKNNTSSGGEQGTASGTLERLIIVIGDSTSTGFNASFAYPDLLESLTGIPTLNLSRDGGTTEFGASRIQGFIDDHRPMYVVILLGTINAKNGISVPGTIGSLQLMANIANNAGVIPVIGTLPPITRSSEANARASAINAGIRSIRNARIAMIDQAIGPNLITDGLHPSDQGQEIIGRLFAAQIY